MPRLHPPRLLALLSLTAAAPAWAAPYSADIELVNPTFGAGSVPGAEAAFAGEKGTVRVGGLAQYALDPLVYAADGAQVGTAVGDRITAQLGVAWDLSDRITARAFLPLAAQWGGDGSPESAVSGVGAGDIGAGARVALLGGRTVGLALGADLRFPTGTREAYLGDSGLRGAFGPSFSVAAGRVDVLAGVQVAGRPAVVTAEDLTLGAELAGDAALRVHLVPDRFDVHVASVARLGLSAGAGAGSVPSEVLLGAQWHPTDALQIDVGVGRGLTAGYGSSRFRAMAGLTWVRLPPREEAEPVDERLVLSENERNMAELLDAEDPEMEKQPEPEAEAPPSAPQPKWEQGELARVEQAQIVIRDPIKFDKSNDQILAGSKPLLAAIAQKLREHPEIIEVVIEGHSSEEGDFAYNYALSMTRASAVCRALIEAGIDARRLSIRGLGEVVPNGTDAAENRRVVFHIVQTAQPGQPAPESTPVPWTGQKVKP